MPAKFYTDDRLLPPRVAVSAELGGIDAALKRFRAAAADSVREGRRRAHYVPPGEARRQKSLRARRRKR